MATNTDNGVGRIISVDQIQKSPRGRKAEYQDDVLKEFRKVTPGNAIVVTAFGKATDKNQQSAIAQKIRNHWKKVNDGESPSINWNTAGEPQVSHKKVTV